MNKTFYNDNNYSFKHLFNLFIHNTTILILMYNTIQ